MSTQIALTQAENGHYHLSGKLVRDTVPSFWQKRDTWLPKDKQIVLDLYALSRVDSAGMAMLVHLQQQIAANKQDIRFINVPSQLKTLMQLSNVENLLNCI